MVPSLGPSSEAALGGLDHSAAMAAAAAAAPPMDLSAFSSGGLFGPGIFSPVTPAAAGAAPDPPSLLMQHQAAPPLSPTQLSAAGGHGGGSLPQSPMLLSPQQPRLASPSAGLPYLQSPQQGGLGGTLSELPLGGSLGGAPMPPPGHLDLPGLAAFGQHLQPMQPASAAAFGASGGLDFGGSLFGGGAAGYGSGGLGLGPGMGGVGGGGLEDWGDLQQQLPSDLGAMLGSDPSQQAPPSPY